LYAYARLILWSVLLVLGGCAPVQLGLNNAKGPDRSILKKPRMSQDSVGLDIFFVRFPFAERETNGQLWNETDEQQIPGEVRRRLAENGFRAGVLASQVPPALSRLLELPDKPAAQPDSEVGAACLESEPRVTRRHLQLRAARRGEIIASGIYDQLPVLLREAGEVCGQTYSQAQGLLAVTSHPQRDGRVQLTLTPELHYGPLRQQWVGGEGIEQAVLRLEAGRPRRVFDTMAVSVTLAPGEMLLLSSLPNRPGSLGHHFLTCGDAERREQKLLIIRLAHTQHNDLLAPSEVLSLE